MTSTNNKPDRKSDRPAQKTERSEHLYQVPFKDHEGLMNLKEELEKDN